MYCTCTCIYAFTWYRYHDIIDSFTTLIGCFDLHFICSRLRVGVVCSWSTGQSMVRLICVVSKRPHIMSRENCSLYNSRDEQREREREREIHAHIWLQMTYYSQFTFRSCRKLGNKKLRHWNVSGCILAGKHMSGDKPRVPGMLPPYL